MELSISIDTCKYMLSSVALAQFRYCAVILMFFSCVISYFLSTKFLIYVIIVQLYKRPFFVFVIVSFI